MFNNHPPSASEQSFYDNAGKRKSRKAVAEDMF
jgi:hypothetical protein